MTNDENIARFDETRADSKRLQKPFKQERVFEGWFTDSLQLKQAEMTINGQRDVRWLPEGRCTELWHNNNQRFGVYLIRGCRWCPQYMRKITFCKKRQERQTAMPSTSKRQHISAQTTARGSTRNIRMLTRQTTVSHPTLQQIIYNTKYHQP